MHVSLCNGFHYFVIFVDDFSRLTYVSHMKDRPELCSILQSFYMAIKTQFDCSLHIYGLIMHVNVIVMFCDFCLHFLVPMVLFIHHHVLEPHNKMWLLNASCIIG